ncbi:MAG: type II toxin-antitoxin system VapB family antitoxin [Mycobacteriales bacterium]
MSRTVIDLDDDLLATAASMLGTTSKRATVHQALRQTVEQRLRRLHVERYLSGGNPDLTNPQLLGQAWSGGGA